MPLMSDDEFWPTSICLEGWYLTAIAFYRICCRNAVTVHPPSSSLPGGPHIHCTVHLLSYDAATAFSLVLLCGRRFLSLVLLYDRRFLSRPPLWPPLYGLGFRWGGRWAERSVARSSPIGEGGRGGGLYCPGLLGKGGAPVNSVVRI
ncbi:unnamed protein product [Urochloa humidicola]